MPSFADRLTRCVFGLTLLGFGIALMVAADLGLAPWDVLHQGISRHTGVPIGTVGIGVGFLVLLAWIPIRERVGVGTVLNVVIIGVVIDLTLLWLDTPDSLALRAAYLGVGTLLWGPGSGLYIGARLGPGPRDGLMTGLARRNGRVGTVRLGIEVGVLLSGLVLGGTAGIGTALFAVTIGPNVAYWLRRFDVGDERAVERVPSSRA